MTSTLYVWNYLFELFYLIWLIWHGEHIKSMQINEALLVFTLPVEGGLWNFCVSARNRSYHSFHSCYAYGHKQMGSELFHCSLWFKHTSERQAELLGMVFLFLTLHENNIICKVGNICSLKWNIVFEIEEGATLK